MNKIKNSISIKNSAGKKIDFESYPYEVLVSPLNPIDLHESIQSGLNLNIHGITEFSGVSGYYDNKLPTGVFSVVLLLNDIYKSDIDSAWIHYSAYDFEAKENIENKLEVINPSPVMRRNLSDETALPGRYNTRLDAESLLYTVNIFGVDGEYTGKL